MSSQLRAERMLTMTVQARLAQQQQPRLRIVTTSATAQMPAFESMMMQLIFSNSEVVTVGSPAHEGMQQMQNHAMKMAAKAAEPDDAPTTMSTVYITSPVSILRGEDDALRTVTNAIRHALDPAEKVALSLLPVKLPDEDGDERFFLDSTIDSLTRSLEGSGVTLCASYEALEQFARG